MPNPYRPRPSGAGYDPSEYQRDEQNRRAGDQGAPAAVRRKKKKATTRALTPKAEN